MAEDKYQDIFKRIDKQPEKLIVEEDFGFDSIMNNPILKPLSEANNRVYDLDEMIYKKLNDMVLDKKWISDTIGDIPEYSTSNFVGRVIKLNTDMTDVIKLQDLIIYSLKQAIKEINSIVKTKYGVIIDEQEQTQKPKEEPKIDYLGYLKGLSGKEGDAGVIAKHILDVCNSDNSGKSIDKIFSDVCVDCYKNETDKNKKKIISQILNMKLN